MTMRWDTQNSSSKVCDIAAARRTTEGVMLDFGVRGTDEDSGASSAECLRRIILDTDAAAALRLLLLRLLER